MLLAVALPPFFHSTPKNPERVAAWPWNKTVLKTVFVQTYHVQCIYHFFQPIYSHN